MGKKKVSYKVWSMWQMEDGLDGIFGSNWSLKKQTSKAKYDAYLKKK